MNRPCMGSFAGDKDYATEDRDGYIVTGVVWYE